MVWRMDDGGVVDLFIHSSKENIVSYPYLYVDHTHVPIRVAPVAFQDSLL